MKTQLITLLACAFALTASAKDKGGKGNSSHHYSPHGYSSHGFLGKGNSGFNPQQYYNRGYYPGNSAFGHSHNPSNKNYNNWDGHVTQRSNYGNLFNLFNNLVR